MYIYKQMKKIFILIILINFITSCGLSDSEKTDLAQLACIELSLTPDSLEKLRIINNLREQLGETLMLNIDENIENYRRWHTCEMFVMNDSRYIEITNQRERAHDELIGEDDLLFYHEYFTYDGKYLIQKNSLDDSSVLVNTNDSTVFTGDIVGNLYIRFGSELLGEFLVAESFKNGLLEGLSKRWYKNGQIAEERNIVNGKLEGYLRNWSENGQMIQESFWINDIPDGYARNWSENGEIIEETLFVDGLAQ